MKAFRVLFIKDSDVISTQYCTKKPDTKDLNYIRKVHDLHESVKFTIQEIDINDNWGI